MESIWASFKEEEVKIVSGKKLKKALENSKLISAK